MHPAASTAGAGWVIGTIGESRIEPEPRWTRLDWLALGAVTAGAALVRLPALNRPVGFVFDEVWYAQNACRYVLGSADCGIEQLASRAHPPLGNWTIGLGIRLFGYDEVGWRVMPALAGILTVALLYLLVRRLLRASPASAATVGAFGASALLAGDFLHVVQSRIAMLDVLVTMWVVAAVLFAVLDRDRPRRLLTGVALGAAVGVKWSGAYVWLAVIPLVVAWEVAARRTDAEGRLVAWRAAAGRAVREEGLRSVVVLGVVPLLVYLAAYISRVPGEVLAPPWQEGTWWRNVWEHQQAMLTFHTTLAGNHPYESAPWSWLLLKRPVAYFFAVDGAAYREILAIGSPLAWWGGALALVTVLVAWARAGWSAWRPEAVVVPAALATYLPWLVLSGDRAQVFLWYILPTLPFLYAALGLAAAVAWRRVAGRLAAGAFAAAVLALFVFFVPLLTALPLSPDAWRSRMWLTDCARPGAPTLELPDDEIDSGPPPSGWC